MLREEWKTDREKREDEKDALGPARPHRHQNKKEEEKMPVRGGSNIAGLIAGLIHCPNRAIRLSGACGCVLYSWTSIG